MLLQSLQENQKTESRDFLSIATLYDTLFSTDFTSLLNFILDVKLLG